MKKSEFTVSMPMSSFSEYEDYKKRYFDLTKNLQSCFDGSLFDAGAEKQVRFDATKALNVCKEFLQVKYFNAEISITA